MTCVNRGMMILLDHATALVQRQNYTNGIMRWIDTLADPERITNVPLLLPALLYMEYCPGSFTCYPRTLDSVCLPIIGSAQVHRFLAVAIFRSLLLLQQREKFKENFFEYMHIYIHIWGWQKLVSSVPLGCKMVGHDRTWTCTERDGTRTRNVQIRGLMHYPLCNALLYHWATWPVAFWRWKKRLPSQSCNLRWNISFQRAGLQWTLVTPNWCRAKLKT